MTIWEYNGLVTQRLFSLNIINIGIGYILRKRNKFWANVGIQAIGWGFINVCIAVVGNYLTNHRRRRRVDPYKETEIIRETKSLRRILLINTALDLLYILGGHLFEKNVGLKHKGHGYGIMIQGAVLFVFDLIHLRNMPDIKK